MTLRVTSRTLCSVLVGQSRGEPIAGSDVTSFYLCYLTTMFVYVMKAGIRLAFGVACRSCSNRDRQVSDAAKQWECLQQWEYFADTGQQNLVEWLKGVRRYELSGFLRQAVVRSNEPGGAMQ